MAKVPLTRDSEFLVGEEKVLDFVLASLFLTLFLYGLIDAMVHKFSKLNASTFIFIIALGLSVVFFRKGKSKRVYIRINKSGIYQDEKLVTGWSHFLKAYITQKQVLASFQDNFILVVEFRRDGYKQGFRKKIPLTNTQNKSEEDVMEAVKFFMKEYKNNPGR